MKEFIKENWFKVIITVILIVMATAYIVGQYIYYQNQEVQIQLNKEKQEQLKMDKQLKCMELWEKRKERLFGTEIANYKVIYNDKLKTCIVGNIYDEYMNTGMNKDKSKYFIAAVDLMNNRFLMHYITYGDEMEYNGMTFERAIKKYEEFGLGAY